MKRIVLLLAAFLFIGATFYQFLPPVTTAVSKTYGLLAWHPFAKTDSAKTLTLSYMARGNVAGCPGVLVKWNADSTSVFLFDSLKTTTAAFAVITIPIDSLFRIWFPDNASQIGYLNDIKLLGNWQFRPVFVTDTSTALQGGTVSGTFSY